MFMFYCLKPWQSWQIVPFSYIWMLKEFKQKIQVLI
jgi:hypothetical protein